MSMISISHKKAWAGRSIALLAAEYNYYFYLVQDRKLFRLALTPQIRSRNFQFTGSE
jgi:hypothetical protein